MIIHFDRKLVKVTPVDGTPAYETYLLMAAFTGKPGMEVIHHVSGFEAIFPPDAPEDCGYQRAIVTELDGKPIDYST